MLAKVNVWSIVTSHFDTFRPYETGRTTERGRNRNYNLGDIFIYYVVPGIAATLLVWWLSFTISDNVANILLTSLSILAALLLNLLLMVFDTLRKFQEENKQRINELTSKELLRWDLLKQTYINISYCILVSLICVLILMCVAIWDTNSTAGWILYLKRVVSFATYFLVLNFSLTLFMVLKRIHNLFSSEIDSFKPLPR